jgi:ligand-binding SRPBCC domain-containing protein
VTGRESLQFRRAPDGFFQLDADLWLPRRRDELFPFFADAFNLETLTPPWVNFSLLTPRPIEMKVGARIDYQLRIRGLPIRWQSEITVWEPPIRFADEQRRGPYRAWIHAHRFEEIDGGTLVRDVVRYAVIGGRLINRLLVQPDVEKIFRFRQQRLTELFR